MKVSTRQARACAALLGFCSAPAAAQQLVWQRPGESPFDEFASAVAAAGDYDGDGRDDLLVGAYRNDATGADAGSASLLSGANGAPLATWRGSAAGDSFGFALGRAGDVDGDGRSDYFVSAPEHSAGNGSRSGCVALFSGADGHALAPLVGSAGERFGWAVAPLGDLDGDGRAELAIGAPRYGVQGADRGRLLVVSAASGATRWTRLGEAAGDWFGATLAALPDLDGDGHADLAVAADRFDRVGADRGRVYLLSGRDGRELSRFDGDAAGDRFGYALSAAADFDGDGRGELLVGAPWHDGGGANAGRLSLHAADGTRLFALQGDAAGDLLGYAVAGLGDVDGDGRGDFAGGAWGHDGAGGAAGKVTVRSGVDGHELFAAQGAAAGERFGAALAAAGDLDGSGTADLVVGAPMSAANGARSGRVAAIASNWRVDRTPQLLSVLPPRGRRDAATAVTLRGRWFTAGPLTVECGGVAVESLVVVDDATATCVVAAGAPGPLAMVVTNPHGSATLADGFARTPALLAPAAAALGSDVALRLLVEPGEMVLTFFGAAPEESLLLPPLGYELRIHLFHVFDARIAVGDEFTLVESLPDDPALQELDFLVQAAAKRRRSPGCFTNVQRLTLE
ncbi:MAG: FG-GAP repeat protein [Planctomycetes bacterium]|nr:FG-GAP repeat protein [Planctomycetota bacterium]